MAINNKERRYRMSSIRNLKVRIGIKNMDEFIEKAQACSDLAKALHKAVDDLNGIKLEIETSTESDSTDK